MIYVCILFGVWNLGTMLQEQRVSNVLLFVYELSGLMVSSVLYSLGIQQFIFNPQELQHLVKNRFTHLSEHKAAASTSCTLCSSNLSTPFMPHNGGITSLFDIINEKQSRIVSFCSAIHNKESNQQHSSSLHFEVGKCVWLIDLFFVSPHRAKNLICIVVWQTAESNPPTHYMRQN